MEERKYIYRKSYKWYQICHYYLRTTEGVLIECVSLAFVINFLALISLAAGCSVALHDMLKVKEKMIEFKVL